MRCNGFTARPLYLYGMSTTFHPQAESAEVQSAEARPAEGAAFAELYERYFPELYDFVVRTMGETERASDVVTSAFIQTLMGFRQRRTAAPVDAILFATARDIALDKQRMNSGTTDPAVQTFLQGRFVEVDASRAPSSAAAPDENTAELVWQLLSAHAADEYSLIDLVVRRGIPVESLAPATGHSVEELGAAVTRSQANVEDWITTALLIHRGSAECPELNAALDQLGPNAPSAELRNAVHEHLDGCGICPAFRQRFPTAAQAFAALAAVPAAEGVREAVWLDISSALESSQPKAKAPRTRASGPSIIDKLDAPLTWWNRASTRARAVAGAIAALGVAAFIAAAILLAPSSGGIGIEDPKAFVSTTHEVGVASAGDIVSLTWEENADATGYSVEWTGEEKTLPDDVADLDGTATGTKSPSLSPGEWYFHLRTRGPEGQWTSTVHLGPFVIADEDDLDDGDVEAGDGSPTPRPSTTVKPTPTKAPTPTPTAAPEAVPEPTDGVFVPEPAPEPEPVVTDPPAPTPAIVQGPCPDTVPLPEAASPSDAMGPVQTVREYYLLINEGRYGEAYDLLTAELQAAYAPFSDWVAGFATTTIVNPLVAVLVEQGTDYAVVYVEVVAVDVDAVLGNTEYLFQGTWVLVTNGGPWEMAVANVGVSVC